MAVAGLPAPRRYIHHAKVISGVKVLSGRLYHCYKEEELKATIGTTEAGQHPKKDMSDRSQLQGGGTFIHPVRD